MNKNTYIISLVQGALLIIFIINSSITLAGLSDETQTFPVIPGGQIHKSLEEQVGEGHGDINTPGSAVYLIKRDPARSIRRGRQLFQRKFTINQGFGPRVNATSSGNIQENRALGAGLSDSCSGCHGRPRGSAGFRGEVVTRPDSRDSPHLFGLGILEMLANEITHDLRKIRSRAIKKAERRGRVVTLDLNSKYINYGSITAYPDGTIDVSRVEGVDKDLRIRPFFAHGGTISIREFIIGAFKAEMGLESPDSVLCQITDPIFPVKVMSPAGFIFDPSKDTFERPPVCDIDEDGDNDGLVNEIDTALIDHMEFYLLNYFKPGLGERTLDANRGLRLMKRIGCTYCHRQNLIIEKDRRIADVETQYNPQQGVFNHLFATASLFIDEVDDGDIYPLLLPNKKSFVVKNIFTDFKRHDLGPYLHEREYDGTMVTQFMT
ncbi:MAG: hypothetical protein KAR12_00675, partial [Methylococcales bacterium]|nr:hypothetical protein [Methylococcales bacterium]